MKILSNFKDYYDYMVGKYGIDPKAVYERIPESYGFYHNGYQHAKNKQWKKIGMSKPDHIDFSDHYGYYELCICGVIYCVTYTGGKYYFGDEATKIIINDKNSYPDTVAFNKNRAKNFHLTKTNTNEENNCPIMWSDDYKNPRLSDFGIQKIIPAEDIWLKINDFLLREKLIVDNRTDKEKIVSAGFDTKTSFRKM